MLRTFVAIAIAAVSAGAALGAQGGKPMSPSGVAAAQVLGKWTKPDGRPAFALGGETYQGGKWIEITYGRPLARGRDLWGSGANYGKDALVGAPIWRAGANISTRLKSEVPLVIGTTTVPAGEYSLFIELKENNWTLVVSSWAAQQAYDPNNKTELWGAYGYTPEKDVVRVPMKLETLPHTVEQLTWAFVDMTNTSGSMALMWGKVMASVPFRVG